MKKIALQFTLSFIAIIASFSCASAAQLNLTLPANNLGLIGHWSMDYLHASSGVMRDLSGQGNNGSIQNIASSSFYASGVIGGAGFFDNSNDTVSMGDVALYDFDASQSFSISMWIKATSTASTFLSKKLNSSGAAVGYYIGVVTTVGGFINAAITDGTNERNTSFSGVTGILDNKWHHVAFIVDRSSQVMTVYVDNTFSGSSSISTIGSLASTQPFKIAGLGNGGSTNASIDDVRVYNRAFTTGDIQRLYNQGIGGKISIAPQNSLSTGLRGYWTFDGKDITNGRLNDVSGNGNHASFSNIASSTFYKPGKIGQGGNFDGTDDKADASSASTLDDLPTNGGMSVSTWMYIEGYGTHGSQPYLIAKETSASGGAGWRLQLVSTNSLLQFTAVHSSTNLTTASVQNGFTSTGDFNRWVHVVATWDGSTTASNVRLYKDGVELAYSTQTNGSGTYVSDAARNFVIGAGDGSSGRNADGIFDEVRVYNRVLTATEVRALYNQGAQKMGVTSNDIYKSGLMGHWTFDGKDIPNGRINDVSGNARHGTLANISTSTFYAPGKIGQGVNFDMVDDRIDLGTDFIGTDAVTITAWIKPKSIGENSQGRIVSNGRTQFYLTSPNWLRFSNDSGGSAAGATTNAIVLNQWQHVAAVRDSGGLVSLYINGRLSGSSGQSAGTLGAATTNLYIGNASTNSVTWDGGIDDVRIYNRVLTADEINKIYLIGK